MFFAKAMIHVDAFEGDMILNPQQRKAIQNGNYGFATTNSKEFQHWPQGKPIAYEITPSIDAAGVTAIKEAIAEYEKHTCLRFKTRTSERAYLSFYRGNGCSSPVGYRGFKNSISLASGCWKKGVVMHEIAHSLGIMHEQSRPDRDNYVKINWHNILPEMRGNFAKEAAKNIDSLGTAYDLCSMMHYGKDAFGAGRITIQVLDKSKEDWIGQRDGFSEIDIRQINVMYKCKNTPVCANKDKNCVGWTSQGYCTDKKEKQWMADNCCKACEGKNSSCGCRNENPRCDAWERMGECWRNKQYMHKYCKRSCKLC